MQEPINQLLLLVLPLSTMQPIFLKQTSNQMTSLVKMSMTPLFPTK